MEMKQEKLNMDKENEILEILQSNNIEYKEHGSELLVKCLKGSL